jgi:hypothetical protein
VEQRSLATVKDASEAIARRRLLAQMRADPSGGPTARECAPSPPAAGSQRRSGTAQRVLLAGMMIVAINLIIDIVYAWIDPRIRLAR